MRHRAILVAGLSVLGASAPTRRAPRFERVYPLAPKEGVFAYARISPDGRYLAYASEMPAPAGARGVTRTVTVVELASKKILFTEPGIDAYWSTDGTRMIYSGFGGMRPTVTIWNQVTGTLTRGVAPPQLGDYYSWGMRDGKNLILTIASNYYYLNGDSAVLPHARVAPCPGIGVGDRPLLSKDGREITTFVRGTVVVRDLTDCDHVFDTGLQGAKADFSWDGRYIAFHVAKPVATGYEIVMVDLKQHTVRHVTDLPGSSYFPSWTRDGRLSFRYDGDDYRGFMMASDVLSAPAQPLPAVQEHLPAERTWSDVFPETALPKHTLNLVMIWSTWSAHSPDALRDLQRVSADVERRSLDVGVTTATDPGSLPADVARLLTLHDIHLPRIPLAPGRLAMTEALNQIPTTLLFRDGRLIDRRLGAQSYEELMLWIGAAQSSQR